MSGSLFKITQTLLLRGVEVWITIAIQRLQIIRNPNVRNSIIPKELMSNYYRRIKNSVLFFVALTGCLGISMALKMHFTAFTFRMKTMMFAS